MVEKRPIDKLTIKGFKTLQDVELELGKLNVLIGPNGAGKSNLVSYFQMLRRLVAEDLRIWTGRQGGADRILTYGAKSTPGLLSSIQFGENTYRFTLASAADDRFVFTGEFLEGSQGKRHRFDLGSGHNEAALKSEAHERLGRASAAEHCYHAISNWQVYHFHDTGQDARIKKTQGLHQNRGLRHDAANLAAYLFRLKYDLPDIYREIVGTIQLVLPFFRDFDLQPESTANGDRTILLQWHSRHDKYEPFLASQLSDGSLRFICLVTALLQPDPPSTIIIDEPELGLHPYAIHLLGALLRSAAQRMQVIVATQSSLLLDEFSVEDLITVELKGGVSVFNRLEEAQFTEWLKDFSVGELWFKNVLGGGIP